MEGDAVDLDQFADAPTLQDAKKNMSLPLDRPVIGYVGRLKTMGQEKGVASLLGAIQLLKERGHAVFCLIVGGPEQDKHYYEDKARSLSLTDQDVRFTGTVPALEVPTATAACAPMAGTASR